jgi:phosphohistidine swiveling domain-containing protein
VTTQTERTWTLPLTGLGVPLALVGGKGMVLRDLASAGFPVPPGFLIPTTAYRRFIAANAVQATIDAALRDLDVAVPASLERAAQTIRQAFHAAAIPAEIEEAIRAAYAALGEPAVAVRSSATAEDLPDLSFAGQQETFLNVRGANRLLASMRDCWASLWSARAIGYRQQMGVGQDDVAMAVVVQRMVPSEVAGVLFTANPATGNRDEMIVEATAGLGEALVAGEVTPELYRLDRQSPGVTELIPAQQKPDGEAPESAVGTSSADGRVRGERLLSDPLLRDLAELGQRVEAHFGGTPQDIEWAAAGGAVWLLQARPITTLPEAAEPADLWQSPRPGATWVRRQVVEHMPEPVSPLFEDLYVNQGLELSAREATSAMGMEGLFDRLLDGPFFITVNGYGYSRANFPLNRDTIPLLLLWIVKSLPWLFRHGVQHWRDEGLPRYLATLARWQEIDPATADDETLMRGIRELAIADAVYWFAAAIAIGVAKVSDSVFDSFVRWAAPGSGLNSGLFLRGFPSKTLEMEAELDAIARRVRQSAELRDYVIATPAAKLLEDLPPTPAGEALWADLERYFARYGHQIYNLDFVAPTLIEDPLPALLGVKGLVREPGQDALARQASVARERDRLTAETAARFDPIRRFIFRKLVSWAQRFAPYREDALFYVGAGWPMLRRFAHELGRRLTEAGVLDTADQVYYLTSDELADAIAAQRDGRTLPHFAELARERQALREARKRLHPPAAVPPTARMQVGALDFSNRETQFRNAPDATTLRGFAVSAGRVTAPASVILSPADFGQMEPGTILVCPTTTPAWTPLFAQARGLVTDIGGILAHGSIVAREYGIPAVMGTGNATQRITSGQEISVDGSAGTVTLAA